MPLHRIRSSWSAPSVIVRAAACAFCSSALLLVVGAGCSSSGSSSSGQGVSATCGNNQLDPGEACDGTAFTFQVTCSFVTGNPQAQGFVGCNSNCTLDSSACGPGGGTAGVGSGGFTGSTGGTAMVTGAGGVGVTSSAGGSTIGASGGVTGTGSVPGTGGDVQGAGGTNSAGGSGTGGSISVAGEPKLPPTPSDCPNLATGNITVLGHQVQIQVGAKRTDVKAPVMFYWHGTGSTAGEVGLLGPAVQEITSMGGIVASFTDSLATGQNTGNNVWYTDDFKMADYILGCAVAQLNIDTHRIYTAGCSAGGLQAGSMVYARSSYLAAAMPNSGGNIFMNQFEDPSHIPSLITAHGSCTGDKVVIPFATTSINECNAVVQAGGIAVDCDHGGSHCGDPAPLVAAQWQFCKDHPFGVNPDPYASGFPSSQPAFAQYCTQYPDPTPPAACQ